jgi:hypothetical protein
MSARTHTKSPATGARLAELLMSAAAELIDAPRADLAPMGIPVRDGRVSLGRLRERSCRAARRWRWGPGSRAHVGSARLAPALLIWAG